MCGIASIFSTSGVHEPTLAQMLKEIVHRGDTLPALKMWDSAGIGMVRLKIVDREDGGQPMFNEDHTVAVVFNGEIYNYRELQQILMARGHQFKTDCDTEVLVHLYEEYGKNMLKYLDGMFAFIIYDSKNNTFFSARDRYGIKPLYYCIKDTVIYFSSEMRAFKHLDVTAYQELPPAHYFSPGGLKPYLTYHTKPLIAADFTTAKKMVRQLTEAAVRKRTVTDLPVGVFLSGGLDSSIVYLLTLKYHKNVTAIIIGEDHAEDVDYAIRLCEKHGGRYVHIKSTQKELLESIPLIVNCVETFEVNVVRGSALSYRLAACAAELGLKIVLCGEGSDEVFGGYGDFLTVDDQAGFDQQTLKFLCSLYRTQLQRIDRTGMAFGVEVREPFMDNLLVDYAIRLPRKYKINWIEGHKMTTKYILREAFRDLLPNEIYSRHKMTLMEGAGAGPVNKDEGMFYDFTCSRISDEQYNDIKKKYPEYQIQSKEEAYYFKIFMANYSKAKFAATRTYNATIEIIAQE